MNDSKTQLIETVLNEISATPEGSKIQRDDRRYLLKLISEVELTELTDFPEDRLPELIKQVTTHIEWLANGWY